MALAFGLTVFAGFSRTYFLKLHYGTPALSVLLHVHGVVFSAWVLLFAAQTTLVAARRTDLHRRLGVAGAVLAGALLVMGTTTAILRVRGGSAPIPGVSAPRSWRSRCSTWWCSRSWWGAGSRSGAGWRPTSGS